MPNDIVVVGDQEELGARAAAFVARMITRKKSSVVALPTGRTPLGMYRELARADVDCSRLWVVAIDEYLGVRPDAPHSLFRWLRRAALDPLGVDPERVLAVKGDDPYPVRACRALDRRLADLGGLDLAVLGLGWNGHVAFNEPGSTARSPTRIVTLQRGTIARNRAYWGGRPVPRRGITIGLRTLIAARRILLLVSGQEKCEVLRAALSGPVTSALPASLLRRGDLTVIADRAAAALL